MRHAVNRETRYSFHHYPSFFLGFINYPWRSHHWSWTLWNDDEIVTGEWSSFCASFNARWQKRPDSYVAFPLLPRVDSSGNSLLHWWPGLLRQYAFHKMNFLLYLALGSTSNLLIFFFHFAKYTQFEPWPGLCSIILSGRRCQHGQQSVTAWTSRSFQFLQNCFLKKRAKSVTEHEQSLNSDTRDLLGNWIKINNLRVYSVFLQSIL